MNWTEKEWALWGKLLLLLWGLTCFAAAAYNGPHEVHELIKIWLTVLGSLSLYTALKNLGT